MKYRLGDICTITKGETGIMKAIDGAYTMVTLGEANKTHNAYQFDTKAVIIPLVSSTGHGHASMKRVKYQEGKFALGSILCAVIPKDENFVLAKYLHIYLHWNREELLVSQMKGMANVSLPMNKIADVIVTVPSLEKQKEIVELEKKLVEKELEADKLYTHQLTLIENLNQAILQEAVQGKLLAKADGRHSANETDFSIPPAKAGGNSAGSNSAGSNSTSENLIHIKSNQNSMNSPHFQMGESNEANTNGFSQNETGQQLLERIKAEKAPLRQTQGTKKEKPLPPIKKEEIPFEIPDNWVWCRLGEICDEILGGFAFDSTRYSKSETIHQVIRLGNVKPNQLVLETSPIFIDETYAREVSKALLQVNDVLITMTGTKAKKDYLFSLCLVPNDLQSKKLYLNQRVGCFRFGNNIYSEFINFVLKDSSILKPVFDSSTGAANQANIGMTALKEILIPLPPLSEQQRIVAEIEKQLSKTKELKAHIIANQQATEQLLKALLHGAFEVEEKEEK